MSKAKSVYLPPQITELLNEHGAENCTVYVYLDYWYISEKIFIQKISISKLIPMTHYINIGKIPHLNMHGVCKILSSMCIDTYAMQNKIYTVCSMLNLMDGDLIEQLNAELVELNSDYTTLEDEYSRTRSELKILNVEHKKLTNKYNKLLDATRASVAVCANVASPENSNSDTDDAAEKKDRTVEKENSRTIMRLIRNRTPKCVVNYLLQSTKSWKTSISSDTVYIWKIVESVNLPIDEFKKISNEYRLTGFAEVSDFVWYLDLNMAASCIQRVNNVLSCLGYLSHTQIDAIIQNMSIT
jgi:hypothetical protein